MTGPTDPIAMFFRACEHGASRARPDPTGGATPDQPSWLRDLAAATAAELTFDTTRARELLDRARPDVPEGPFRNVLLLVELRAAVRDAKAIGVSEALERLERLVASLPAAEIATRARALHSLAIARMRLGRVELAEEAITDALAIVDDGPVRMWMTDTVAQLLIGQGAWSEAVRTLVALIARRRAASDNLGVAISAGHLSRLHTQLGRPDQGAAIATEALAALSADAPPLTRLRLQTLLTNALLEHAEVADIELAAQELERLVEKVPAAPHYLRGYAMMALARTRAATGDVPGAQRWLDRASAEVTLPAHVALLRHHEAVVDPRVTRNEAWRAGFEELVAKADFVSEAEMKTLLLVAGHERDDGNDVGMRERLDHAHRRAMHSNNPLWMKWVDDATAALDPAQHSERVAHRFTGRSRRELQRTTREECTIIFADLVDFTPRTLELSPEEVMDTVRGLFELGVPLLAKHRVTPISYMGDGLLALCQGEGHQRRGLSFARDLVARAGRVSKVRRMLGGGWPVDLRAGVASGPVVLGTLGTSFKTEFAAIGVATNLAARLQSKALPGEVMCSAHTVRDANLDLPAETMTLKGFEKWDAVEACRIRVYTPDRS
jgi:class 3 adenylate cyclase